MNIMSLTLVQKTHTGKLERYRAVILPKLSILDENTERVKNVDCPNIKSHINTVAEG